MVESETQHPAESLRERIAHTIAEVCETRFGKGCCWRDETYRSPVPEIAASVFAEDCQALADAVIAAGLTTPDDGDIEKRIEDLASAWEFTIYRHPKRWEIALRDFDKEQAGIVFIADCWCLSHPSSAYLLGGMTDLSGLPAATFGGAAALGALAWGW